MSVYIDHALKLTYEDLKQIPEDDLYRHELYDGIHVASPSPVTRHQDLVKRIFHGLYETIEMKGLGVVYTAPFDVELAATDVYEPDVLVVLNRNRHIITDTHVVGAPDLVVEVLSPSTASRDRRIKRNRYEELGIPEYWIVDPDDRSVTVFRRTPNGASFAEPLVCRGGGVEGVSPAAVTFRAAETTVRIDLTELFR